MQKNTQRTVLFLLGPTATGKTEIVINLLNNFTNTFEIISVDSVQIYKDCNVGSGKPDDAILKRYHHHLINHIDLNDPTNNCLDVAIITAPEKRTKKTIEKLKTVAGRVLNQ